MRQGSFNFIFFQRVTGNLFFVVMLVYSIVYAVERTTYVDSAWLFFERVNWEKFSFPGDRYGAIFSEIPLFILSKFHLPLTALVYVFSISYIVLYYFVWRLCTYSLKNPIAGLTVVLGMIMGARETFIHTASEVHQCIAYSALLFAILQFDFPGKKKRKIILSCLVALLVMLSHPLGLFSAGFALIYFCAGEKKVNGILPWALLLIIISCALFNFLHPPNPYDANQYHQLRNSPVGISSITDSGALQFLTLHFPHFYWLPELAALFVAIAFIIRKEWLKLGAVGICVVGYLLIAFVTFRNGDSSIMIERVFLPAFFMINIALADLLVTVNWKKKWIAPVVAVFFIINGIHYINGGCLMYKKRVQYLDELVRAGIAQGHDKYFLTDQSADDTKILVPWALGTETLIYSKLKYNRCISIVHKQDSCPDNYFIASSFLSVPVSELNPAWFHLTTGKYYELKKITP